MKINCLHIEASSVKCPQTLFRILLQNHIFNSTMDGSRVLLELGYHFK